MSPTTPKDLFNQKPYSDVVICSGTQRIYLLPQSRPVHWIDYFNTLCGNNSKFVIRTPAGLISFVHFANRSRRAIRKRSHRMMTIRLLLRPLFCIFTASHLKNSSRKKTGASSFASTRLARSIFYRNCRTRRWKP